jgi:RNA polymerase sigma factor (sigma-70 family)
VSDPSGPQDPGELVRSAAEGDKSAWEELVKRYAGLVWSVGYSFRLNAEDTADVAQTVWLILIENLGKLREPSYIARWLVTTTRRESLRVLNKRGREVPGDMAAALGNATDTEQPEVDHFLLVHERNAQVRAAFYTLTEQCQRLLCLLLHDPPVPYAEIAAQLGTSVGSIGPTRGRCLDNLRRLLKDR